MTTDKELEMLISWFKFAICELTKSGLWLVSFLAVLTRVALVEMKVILIHGMKVQDRVHAMMLSSYKIFFSIFLGFIVPLLLNIVG